MINTMLSTSQALYGFKVLDHSRTSARLNLQRCSMTPTEHAASERLLLTLCNASRSAQFGEDAGCPQSRRCASPACRPFSVDNRYRRCGRARALRSLPSASSSKLDLTRERGAVTSLLGQQLAGGSRRDGGGGRHAHGVGGSAHAKEPPAGGGRDGGGQ